MAQSWTKIRKHSILKFTQEKGEDFPYQAVNQNAYEASGMG